VPDTDKRARLLYDGDCGVCARTAEILQRLDSNHDFIIQPYGSFTEEWLAQYGLSYDKCSKRAYCISPGGKVWGGAFAVNYFFFKRFPWCLLVFLVYAIPPLLVAELIGYYLVARNRYRISRWLGLDACRVSPRSPASPQKRS
jgi:predicted DCC family thiol-disulfide oxidoreductase YuxK